MSGYSQVSEELCQVGAEVPGAEWTEEVWPQTELPAAAQEQGEPGDSGRGSEGIQEEHWISPGQNQQEVGGALPPGQLKGPFDCNFKISTLSQSHYVKMFDII